MTRYLARVLVADRDPEAQNLFRTNLRGYGFSVVDAYDGQEAIRLSGSEAPDVMLLDLDLPDMEGTEVIRRIREWSDVPILVVTAHTEEWAKVTALDCGANDYIIKPFGMAELTARIRAALRSRMQMEGGRPVFRFGDVVVDLVQQRVTRAREEVKLSRREYALLRALVRSVGQVVPHEHLLAEVWRRRHHLDRDYLRSYVMRLRRKLEADPLAPRHIMTEAGVGYRLVADEAAGTSGTRGPRAGAGGPRVGMIDGVVLAE
jgi:two-component system, OmpR family, KDP operon response regulator KdpE